MLFRSISDDGVSVNLTTTSADGAFAGFAVVAIPTAEASSTTIYDDEGRRNWGWIIVHGPMTANITAGGTSAAGVGKAFITSTDAAKIAGYPTAAADAGWVTTATQSGTSVGGFFLDAPAAGDTTAEVFITRE